MAAQFWNGPQERRVTMKDVAKRAGVSQPTVSFVLNDRRDVSIAEATRQRVLAAAAELDYRPNRAAQALRSNLAFTIGVIADEIVSRPYAGQIVLGLQQAVQPAGYVCYVVERARDGDATDAALGNLFARGVSGLVYAAPGAWPISPIPSAAGARSIFVNCWPPEDPSACIVLADEYEGGRLAAAAAFEAGHRRVAFIGGPAKDYACQQRERGFLAAASDAGVDGASLPRAYGNYHIGGGYELALKVLPEQSPTAIVCGNDRMAIGVLLAAHALGLECPRDVSIIGFDDQPDLADQVHPAFTTVALPHLEMGLTAGRMMLDPADPDPGRHLIDCTLVMRESLAPPPPGTR